MRGYYITSLYILLALSTAVFADEDVCSAARDGDLLRHEECNKYYACDSSRPVEKRCNGDLLFNLETLQCDSPHNVDCEGRIAPTDDVSAINSMASGPGSAASTDLETVSRKKRFLPNGCPETHIHWLLPHETNCSLFYYCVWGDLVLRECPAGTHFNSAIQVCDWPYNAKCSKTTSVSSTPASTTSEQSTLLSTIPEPTISGLEPKPDFQPNGCPVNPHIHWLLPHKTNCSLFYYCVWGELVLRECPLGTHFNSAIQVCDWPQSANCLTSTTTVQTTPEPTTSAPTTLGPTTLEPTTPEPTPTTAVPTAQEATTQEATTQEPITPEPTTPEPTTAAPTTQEPTTSKPTKPDFLPNGCPVNPHIHWLLPHETNCSLFYYCVWGELVLRECPLGTHFNSAIQVCDWPQNANCSTSTTPVPTTIAPTTQEPITPEPTTPEPTTAAPTTQEPTTSEPTPTTAVPTTEEATTQEPITPEPTTPEPTTAAPTTQEPTTSKPTKPDFLPNGCPVNPHIHWLLPHETNCSLFYYCVWGELVLRECPLGTHFNSAIQVCDWPQNANCSTSTTPVPTTVGPTTQEPTTSAPTTLGPTTLEPTTPEPTPTTAVPTTQEPTTEEATTQEPITPEPTTPEPTTAAPTTQEPTTSKPTKPDLLPNGCPVDPHIHWLLPHETNCSLFYYCVWGKLVLRECPLGTHFNSAIQVCDWPQNANCSTSTTPVPTTVAPTTQEPTTQEPITPEPTTPEPTPTTAVPTTQEPTTQEPTTQEATTQEPITLEPTTPEPTPTTAVPTTQEPTTQEATTQEPITPEPTTPEPTTAAPTTQEPTTSKPTKPDFLPNGCPVNPHIHWLLPHETNCSLFYYCVWGELVLRECPLGTHFNSAIQVCDWPQNAKCSTSASESTTAVHTTTEPITPESTSPESTTPGLTTQKQTTPQSTTPEFLPNGCPVNPHIHWLLPHGTDCTMFYYCVWGDLVLRQCAPGTHFNRVLQVCDWPQNAGCMTTLNKHVESRRALLSIN